MPTLHFPRARRQSQRPDIEYPWQPVDLQASASKAFRGFQPRVPLSMNPGGPQTSPGGRPTSKARSPSSLKAGRLPKAQTQRITPPLRGAMNTVANHSSQKLGNWQSPRVLMEVGRSVTPPPRPQTRTLHYSELCARGLQLPHVSSSQLSDEEQGENVGSRLSGSGRPAVVMREEWAGSGTGRPAVVMREEWAGNGAAVHLSFFHSDSPMAARLKTSTTSSAVAAAGAAGGAPEGRKGDRGSDWACVRNTGTAGPPGTTCYICGRRYGHASIAIHEPQCLRKWQAENSKLPIRERKPLPKKPVTRSQGVGVASAHDARRVGGRATEFTSDVFGAEQPEVPDGAIERYFQNAYAQFEQELKPCRTCGRSFAPERWAVHVGNCKATPLAARTVHRPSRSTSQQGTEGSRHPHCK